ncbi:MAG: Ppx/GppA phosphatase family protein [Oscillatoria sp. PMC 1068.18]|nr:Ppx/GppA phosphatase family protein [Oscillatoria sp. PMC 1068.18]
MVNSLSQVQTDRVNLPTLDPDRERILAAIDIGTNSIHMVVVRLEASLPTFTIIAKEKDTARLGDRDRKTGNLTPEAKKRAFAALQRCKDLAISFGAEQIVAVATSAVREAPNGREFLEEIDSELGIFVNLISGQEEARRIYLGVLSGMEFNHDPHMIIDIGGGSTELILGDSHEPRFLSSTKVGAVRLTQEFVNSDPISDQEIQYLQAYVRGMLERPVEEMRSHLASGEKLRLVGTSGTIETLAEIHAKEHLGTVPSPLQGYEFSREDLEAIIEKLADLDYSDRADIPGMSEKRAEIIVPGAIILLEAMKMLDLESIIICERALREGIIVDWMLTHGLIENRLMYQSEVRERSVYKLAHKYQVNLDYSNRVANFALNIFDQTQGTLHDWTNEERELLWSAAILHNSGLYISHSAHHKHSYYLIRNGELLGFTETEIEVIANLARYHRRSKPKKKHDNYKNLPNKKYRHLVEQISAILRLAVALDRRQIGAIKQVNCHYQTDKREVRLQLIPADSNDDCSLELWNLDYKKEFFEEEFAVKVIASLSS